MQDVGSISTNTVQKLSLKGKPYFEDGEAFLYSAESYSIMGCGAHVKISETQETNKILGTPNRDAIVTTETLN